MPESFVIGFLHREIQEGSNAIGGTSGLPPEDPAEHGYFICHSDCCARVEGNRHTVSLHACPPQDPVFLALPKAYKRPPKNEVEKQKQEEAAEAGICRACTQSAGSDEDEDEDDSSLDHAESVLSTAALDPDRARSPCLSSIEFGHGIATLPNTEGLDGERAEEIINRLSITGRLLSAMRGKEMILAISNFVIRVNFGLQGHCFWLPTTMYEKIVSCPPVARGTKSKTYRIPEEYQDGPPGNVRQVSIQAAFVRPHRTLIFVDHNVMISFHVMACRRYISVSDLLPNSQLWPMLWSSSHGPDLFLEHDAWEVDLLQWREESIATADGNAIFLAVKSNQRIFNGYGAQETCDMLIQALIHPCMPVHLICSDDALFKRFRDAVVEYRHGRRTILAEKPWARTSSERPFFMNDDSHGRFLSTVPCYRRSYVPANQNMLDSLHALNLLDPDMVIQANGKAQVPLKPRTKQFYSEQNKPKKGATRVSCQNIRLPNYHLSIPSGWTASKPTNVYTPIIAQPGEPWWPIWNFTPVQQDVKAMRNSATLGPYSFDVFVQGTWSKQKVHEIPHGRRALDVVSNSRRKRPRATSISKPTKALNPKKRKSLLASKYDIPDSSDVNTRTSRSGLKVVKS